MANFVIGTPLETTDPAVECTVTPASPLTVGRHRFQLEVIDDSGNRSLPDAVEVIVKDTKLPTAVLKMPTQVEFGQSFTLDGRGSSDVLPGRLAKFIWTRLE
jgi:hypothetical protein